MGRFAAIGKRLGELDKQYADKVRDFIVPNKPDGSAISVGRGMTGHILGSPLAAKITFGEDEHMAQTLAEKLVRGAVPAASATARYVVPGAMMTAAGAGLADLTQNFYDSMADTPVLPS